MGEREPGNIVARRRLVGPSFTGRKLNIQVVDALRRIDRALGAAIGAQNDPHRLICCHFFRTQVMTLAGRVFEMRLQRNP